MAAPANERSKQMNEAPNTAVSAQAIPSFLIFVVLLVVAFAGAAIGSLAPIDFIYDGI